MSHTAPVVLSPCVQIPLPVRPAAHGKFLYAGNEKFYVCGVTYGTFRPNAAGEPYPEPDAVARDFRLMTANGINAVRVYTMPPRWLLDLAQAAGLRVMVGLAWEQHISFLDDAAGMAAIRARVRSEVRACAGHPAILCYSIGNEIPAPIVRWYGQRRIARFLKQLYDAVKAEDPDGLVTYVNYPTTEYLRLPFLDVVTFNVYLEAPDAYDAYLARLQNLAGERPLVMAEIGLDSHRNGLSQQAVALDWQARMTFGAGCAGAFVFAWTDEWRRGDLDVDDWDFGLTTRGRQPKPALEAVRRVFAETPIPCYRRWPRVSVIVCTYNGSRYIHECLRALGQLNYPDYEVVVVDDGSTDATANVVRAFDCRLISTANRGLSSARNTGLDAATGEIVAYIDDDAYPDPHWLHYLVTTFERGGFAAAGGPNITPPGDGLIADSVANAPGNPIHVLLSDREAEHIPGCNMAFWRERLLEIGGFDPQYRVAGDDVDVCWRIQERGGRIGYSPAAVVWHHRRNSVRTYWKQQAGYGRAEALLEQKWPEKYNAAGHVSWTGRLYAPSADGLLTGRDSLIFHGVWGGAPFQSLYQPIDTTIWSLPRMPEWHLLTGLLAIVTGLGVVWHPLLLAFPLLLLAVGVSVVQAILQAASATPITPPVGLRQRVAFRVLVTGLHLMQPIARLRGRWSAGLTPWRWRGRRELTLPRPRTASIWREEWQSVAVRLRALEQELRTAGVAHRRGGAFDRWDLDVRGGLFATTRLQMVIEEHGAGRQMVRVQARPHSTIPMSALTTMLLILVAVAGSTQSYGVLAVVALGVGTVIARSVWEAAVSMRAALAAFERSVTGGR